MPSGDSYYQLFGSSGLKQSVDYYQEVSFQNFAWLHRRDWNGSQISMDPGSFVGCVLPDEWFYYINS